jgi:2-polyprenyl-3-methyl-5-hydroxy-6-metoxy-1,4-benzoquinol methylase
MNNKDSKELWLKLEKTIPNDSFMLGRYTTQAFFDDPACLAFITSRYKFCAKILSGFNTVLEIGCGDGFGGAIVAQRVDKLICTDINEPLLKDNSTRMTQFSNIHYEYHDFRESPFRKKVDGIYFVDVIEHIFQQEEHDFLSNLSASLNENGICLIGTPNIRADKYASKYSKASHVNLKDYKTLRAIGDKYFNNSLHFGMNDEIVHTGFPQMAHYLWLVCIGPRQLDNL